MTLKHLGSISTETLWAVFSEAANGFQLLSSENFRTKIRGPEFLELSSFGFRRPGQGNIDGASSDKILIRKGFFQGQDIQLNMKCNSYLYHVTTEYD